MLELESRTSPLRRELDQSCEGLRDWLARKVCYFLINSNDHSRVRQPFV